jgi:ABC-2 type transport system ATP-binding protein
MTAVAVEAPAAALDAVSKAYGPVAALTGVTLGVGRGEVVGLLGPNGAGKSTAVKILLGLVHPNAGGATLCGRPSTDPEARRTVGYLPELFRFPAWMTGRQLLRFHGELAGLDRGLVESQIPVVLDQVGMADRADRRIGTYSKGMSQRIGLGQAILGEPTLVILDEPTSALDPVGRREVRELIKGLRARGVAVLLNSHLLTEVESVCDRVAMIDRGRMIYQGSLDELTGRGSRLEVRVDRIESELVERLGTIGVVEVMDDSGILVTLADPDLAGEVAATVVAAGRRLLAMVPAGSTLEDVFVQMVRGGDR